MAEHLELEHDGGIPILRMSRPPANALDPPFLEELIEAARQLRGQAPPALVLSGLPGFFSAGVDLSLPARLDADGQRRLVDGLNGAFGALYSLPFPVVAAVTGHAIAGGLLLTLCADHRVAAAAGKLGLTELRAGLRFPQVPLAIVRAELAQHAARRLVLGAGLVTPDEALALGAVDEVVPLEEVEPRALAVARALADLPRDTYAQVKEQLRGKVIEDARGDPFRDGWFGPETRAAAAAILDR